MTGATPEDPQQRIVALALQLAAHPPLHRNRHAFEARVPWRLIADLRAALADAGLDWHAVHEALRTPDV